MCRLRLVGPSDEIHSVQVIMSGASDLSTICCEQQTLWRLEANNYVHSLAASVGRVDEDQLVAIQELRDELNRINARFNFGFFRNSD